MEEDIQLGEEGGPSPPLDHGAQKARSVLSHKGSLGKRRKPSRESIHTFLTSVSWNGTANDVTSDREANRRHVTKTIVNLSDLNGTPKSTRVQISAPKMSPETKPVEHTPRVTTVHIKGTTVSSNDQKTQPSPRTHRFIVDVETTKHLLHRRDPSLDSGCSLDLSCSDAAQDSASSGKGSPDPGLAGPRSAQLVVDETLSPPAEFADSPMLPRHKEAETVGSPDVREISTRDPRVVYGKHSQLGRASSLGPPSPGIRVNFRILPRADDVATPTIKPPPAAPPTPRSAGVGRSESLRVGALQTWDHRRPPKLDPERRCRSLSRTTSATPDEQPQQPEWMHIARQKQNARVDWENFEANMKEPNSISCTNLSESHMKDRVTLPSPGQKPLLTRSVSAVYPRIKMSRFERRMRRDNKNPSPERKLSDDFNIVSDSTQSSGTTSSSTEDEKPPFLNVQLRHVEKTPPLNVVFQTSRPGEDASPTLPRRLLKSPFCEESDGGGLPRLQKKKEISRVDDGLGKKESGEVKQQDREKILTPSHFLQPKPVEVIEGQREGARSANDVPPRIRSPTNLKRSASVQMRPKLASSGFSRRLSPRPRPELQASTEDMPSWVQEAQRKRNSGIDWDRLDKSLSETCKHDGVSMSTECLHKLITTTETPVWLKEVQKRKEENARLRTHRFPDEPGKDDDTLPKTRPTETTLQNCYKSDTGKASTKDSLTIETTTVVPAKESTSENGILKTSHTSTHRALFEPGDNAPRIVDVQPKETIKADRMATVESRSKFLDEIFSEAEGTEDEQPTKVCYTPDSLAPSRESDDSSDSEKHTKKQALMMELKCVLKKRSPPPSVTAHKCPGATSPDKPISAPQTERRPQDQGSTAPIQNGHSVPEDTFLKPSEVRAFSFPPPPPVLPPDFPNGTRELPSTPPLINGTKHHPCRDSETQTLDNSHSPQPPQIVNDNATCASPIAFHPNQLLNSSCPLMPNSASQLLILHSTGVLQQPQPVNVYTMPICHPVFSQVLSQDTSPSQRCLSTQNEKTESDTAHLTSTTQNEKTESDTAHSTSTIQRRSNSAKASDKNETCSEETVPSSPGPLPCAETHFPNAHSKDPAALVMSDIRSRDVDIDNQAPSGSVDNCSIAGRSSSLLRRQENAVSSIMDAILPYMNGDDVSDINSVISGAGQESLFERDFLDGRQAAESVISSAGVTKNVMNSGSVSGRSEPQLSSAEVTEHRFNGFKDVVCDEPDESPFLQPKPDSQITDGQKGVTLVSSTSTIPRMRSITLKDLKEPPPVLAESSTVTTGPDGTVRGGHFKHYQPSEGSIRNRQELCNLFARPKSYSVPNLLSATDMPRPRKKATASASTQTPNGIISKERLYVINDEVGNTRGVQTDSGSKLKVTRSSRDVELVTKVDSSGPSKTMRKKVTTKIVRGSNGKPGGVREVVEEYCDQSSVTVRPLTASKGVTRCVRQTSDGRKYLSTVVTDTAGAVPSTRTKRGYRKDKDREGRVIMV